MSDTDKEFQRIESFSRAYISSKPKKEVRPDTTEVLGELKRTIGFDPSKIESHSTVEPEKSQELPLDKLGKNRQDLYFDRLLVRRNEVRKKEGVGLGYVSVEERREMLIEIEKMSDEEVKTELEKIAAERARKEESKTTSSPLPPIKEPSEEEIKRYERERGNYNADLTEPKD